MALLAKAIANPHAVLDETVIRDILQTGLQFQKARVLVLIPDHTRTLPLPQLFRLMVDVLRDTTQLDFMVALGTHPPLSFEQLLMLVGLSRQGYENNYAQIGLLNHAWDDPQMLRQLGVLPAEQIKAIAGEYWHPSLGGDVAVRINRLAMTYDHIIILGPTFPHEVVGFSGGAKYLFPGISGPEMI
ncbi:MAG: nickel-dependent lactate racemase, partial [Anaerolineae bacterium]|nr:nickel-dependent lactate racemase [Anaerolineae bacterium]